MDRKTILVVVAGVLVGGVIGFASAKYMPARWFAHTNKSATKKAPTNSVPKTMNHAQIKSEEQFLREMIPHHQEAVDSSKIVLEKTDNKEIKKLAQNIIDEQTKEITTLERWLKARYPNSTWEASTGTTYMAMMPKLENLSDDALENAYLQGMVMHHQAAINMANQVIRVKPHEELVKFAQSMIKSQAEEVQTMRALMDDIRNSTMEDKKPAIDKPSGKESDMKDDDKSPATNDDKGGDHENGQH